MKAVEFESVKGGNMAVFIKFYKIKNWFPWKTG